MHTHTRVVLRGGGGEAARVCWRVDGVCPRTRELVRAHTGVGRGCRCVHTSGLFVRAGAWAAHACTPVDAGVCTSTCVAHRCAGYVLSLPAVVLHTRVGPEHGVFHRGAGECALQGDLEHKHQVRNRAGTPHVCTNAAQVCVTRRVSDSQRHGGVWGGLQSCSFTCEGPARAG